MPLVPGFKIPRGLYLFVNPDGVVSTMRASLLPLKKMVDSCCYDTRLREVMMKIQEKQEGKQWWRQMSCWWVAWNGPENDRCGEKHQQALVIGPIFDVSFVDEVTKTLDQCSVPKDWAHLVVIDS